MIANSTPIKQPHILADTINNVLSLDEEIREAIVRYAGSIIAIELLNTRQTLYLQITGEGIAVVEPAGAIPDISVRGTPGRLFAYLIALKRDEPATSGVIEITGNIALAQKLAEFARRLDPDWEGKLSEWIGDVPARCVGNMARATLRLAGHVGDTVHNNMGEYLLYESGMVAEPDEVSRFVRAVDMLRNDVERLGLRLDRLQQRTRNTD